jgi:eukaryotic-like serine/threonine-protein kinase
LAAVLAAVVAVSLPRSPSGQEPPVYAVVAAAALAKDSAVQAHPLALGVKTDAALSTPQAELQVGASELPTQPASGATAGGPKRAPEPAPPSTKPKAPPQVGKTREARTQGAVAPAAPVVTGTVQLAISPWGLVEVNGAPAGTTPPLTRLTLPEGTHSVTVRNEDFPPMTFQVQVVADKPTTVRHRFTP